MRKVGQLLIVLVAIVAASYLLASEQPAIPFLFHLPSVSVLYDLAIGYLVSLIFWILVVLLPDIQRRRMLRKSLEERYRYFRSGIVGVLLSASEGTYDLDNRDKLTEPSEFRRYFSENDDEKWYAALNGLQSQKIRLDELL